MRSRFIPLGLAFHCIAFCQEKPDAAVLLEKVRAKYAAATRFHLVWTRTQQKPHGDPVFSGDFEETDLALELPDKMRLGETGSKVGIAISSLAIVDGIDVFVYETEANKYFEAKAVPPDTPISDVTDENQSAFWVQSARGVIDGLLETTTWKDQASVLGNGHLTLANGTIDCWLIQIKEKPFEGDVTTLWIDKRRYLIRRQDTATRSAIVRNTFKIAAVGDTLPPDIFKFSPPSGARKVSKMADLGSK